MGINTIIIDMYGVIIKDKTGNFLQFVYDKFNEAEHEHINKLIYEEKLFTKAGYGEISSNHFLSALGFSDPDSAMKEYIENYLTFDDSFYSFAEKFYKKYDLVLLSTDVSEWSRYITEYYKLDKYFKHKIVSGDVHLRKPDRTIYELTLERIGRKPEECLFIDDSVTNLQQASEMGINTIFFNRFDNCNKSFVSVKSFDNINQFLISSTNS